MNAFPEPTPSDPTSSPIERDMTIQGDISTPRPPSLAARHPLLGAGRPQLPEELRECQLRIEEAAVERGLSFDPIIYEMLQPSEVNAIAARDGFPIRYPHWRFGMEYEFLNKSYEHGSSKIYELVINNNPVFAYLMDSNHGYDQEFVIAHVTGHADFFKNNIYFSQTNKQAVDMMASHAVRIQRYMNLHGRETVEKMIDRALSIEDLIDPYQLLVAAKMSSSSGSEKGDYSDGGGIPGKIRTSRSYLDPFVNPPEMLERFRAEEEKKAKAAARRFPEKPSRDVMQFLIEHAPLEDWQRDVLSIVRAESLYFLPQRQTKILNEGWASYWHSELMRAVVLDEDRVFPFAHLHSGVTATNPQQLNPYKLGIELLRDIEDRWNKGRFGPEWESCTDMAERANWDKKLGLGREKLFEVRRYENDLSFISNYLTMEFCEKHGLFTFSQNKATGDYVIRSREFNKVRETLVRQLINAGRPIIELVDGNLHNRGEFRLQHVFEKDPLREDYAARVLDNLYHIWTRPVHIDSQKNGEPMRYTFDARGYRKDSI